VTKIRLIILIIIEIILIIFYTHNLLVKTSSNLPDINGHLFYLKTLALNRRIPFPLEGWETYQPPLFYLIMSPIYFVAFIKGFPILQTIQLFQIIIFLDFLALVFYTFAKLIKDSIMLFLTLTPFLFLPLFLYLVFIVSNEFLSTVIISLGLLLIIDIFHYDYIGIFNLLLFGLILSLAILTKYTGFILILTYISYQSILFISRRDIKSIFISILIPILLAFIFASPIYFRNYLLSGKIFPFSVSSNENKPTDQPPGYRTISSFLDFSWIWPPKLYQAKYTSVTGGTFFSFWNDDHQFFFIKEIPLNNESNIYCLITYFLTSLVIFGFFLSLLQLRRRGINSTINKISLFFSLYVFFLISAYILYNIYLPFYSTSKAIFISSVYVPVIFFFYQANNFLITKIFRKVFIILLSSVEISYLFLILKFFWK